MALTKTQVSELYVAIFNRASEGEGNSYWQQTGMSASAAADAMLNSADAEAYFGDSLDSDQAFIEHIYENTLDKTVADDADGIAYWVGLLESGSSRGEVVSGLIDAVASYANSDDPATAKAFSQFQNRVAVSNYTADNLESAPADYESSLRFGDGLEVDDNVSTVGQAQQQVDKLEEAEGNDPGIEGDTIRLTSSTDRVEGTENNDTFEAFLGQNEFVGGVSNTLSSADNIEGGAGNDSLYAQLVEEFVGAGSTTIDVQPTINSVETIDFEARDLTEGGGSVTVDAKNISGVDTIGSKFSDGDLVIENLTTLDENGNARNTEDLTISMDHTDNFNSDGDASDLTVYFDEDYLLSGQTSSTSQANYWLLDEDSENYNEEPLLNIERNGVSLEIDGTPIDIVMDQDVAEAADTWTAYANALQARIDQMVAEGVTELQGINVIVDRNNLDSTFNDFGVEVPIPAITLLDSQGRDLTPTGFISPEDATGAFDIYGNFDNVESVELDNPLAVDVELEKVGREGEGGNLTIGGKSQSMTEGQGIEVFNIDVLGADNKPSNLGQITSTNGALKTLNIATGDEFVDGDSFASLTVRGESTVSGTGANPFGGTVDMINATEFLGDLTIGNETAAQNVNTLNATGGGDVSFFADINEEAEYAYTTGAGEDAITVNLDSDAIDTAGTGLEISTGAGNDTVTLDELASGVNDASQLTMAELDNVNVRTGQGNDRVNVESDVNANISTGAGTDFVNVNAEGVLNNQAGGNEEIGNQAAYEGEWAFGQASGAQAFGERVLYNAELTVTFAGFESTVAIETDSAGNFVASQQDINAAIIDAITSDADLNRLLQTEGGEGVQQLIVQSLVNGENNLGIQINQPEVVEQGATGGQVNLDAGDVNSLTQGLIETTGNDSSTYPNAGAVAGAIVDGNIAADGTAGADYAASTSGGSTDATVATDVNFSTVNLGAGSDDLVAFDSNDASANVLEIDGVFGNASVVNFHNSAPSQVTSATEVGNHALDFTAFLDNQVDPSANNNQLSAQDLAVSLNIVQRAFGDSAAGNSTAEANSVNMLRFTGDAGNASAIDWEGLNAGNLVAALNGDTGAATLGDGSINDATLDAAANTTNLIGNTQDHIVMVENVANPGEYKVFQLSSTVDADTDTTDGEFDTNATELGTLDFGNSINFQLVGSTEWETTIQDLLKDADNAEEPVGPQPDALVSLANDTGVDGDNITSDASLNVTADATDTVEYNVNNTGFGAEYNAATLTDGANTVGVRVTDAEGNVETESVQFTLDSTAPAKAEADAVTYTNGGNDSSNFEVGDTITLNFAEEVTAFTDASGEFALAEDGMSASVVLDGETDPAAGGVALTGVTDVAGNTVDLTFNLA